MLSQLSMNLLERVLEFFEVMGESVGKLKYCGIFR